MSHGKEAARDLRYGRRGGGWLPGGLRPGYAIDDLERIRRRAGDDWPSLTPAVDLSNPDGGSGKDWPGAARMAAARQAAGVELTRIDREALRRQERTA